MSSNDYASHGRTRNILLLGATLAAVVAGTYFMRARDSRADTSDGFRLAPANVPALVAHLDEPQVSLVSDGVVTWGDYRAAFESYSACVREQGGNVTDVTVNAPRRMQARVSMPVGEDPTAAAAKLETCRQRRLATVDQLWAMHNAPSAGELNEARSALAAASAGQVTARSPGTRRQWN